MVILKHRWVERLRLRCAGIFIATPLLIVLIDTAAALATYSFSDLIVETSLYHVNVTSNWHSDPIR